MSGIKACFLFLGFLSLWASDPRSVYNNKSGIHSLTENKTQNAQKDFLKALESEPEEARLHLNLGLAFQLAKDPERAFKEYQTGLKFAKTDEIKFFANFNAAQVLGEKDIDLALSYYQQALKYRPDSIETKHNIELLMQKKSGGSQGDSDDKDKKQGSNDTEDRGQDRTNQPTNEPQPYKGKELSQQDVENILEELKNQDQKVRAKENSTGGKDRPLDKDW